jgi:hypothetical protein
MQRLGSDADTCAGAPEYLVPLLQNACNGKVAVLLEPSAQHTCSILGVRRTQVRSARNNATRTPTWQGTPQLSI